MIAIPAFQHRRIVLFDNCPGGSIVPILFVEQIRVPEDMTTRHILAFVLYRFRRKSRVPLSFRRYKVVHIVSARAVICVAEIAYKAFEIGVYVFCQLAFQIDFKSVEVGRVYRSAYALIGKIVHAEFGIRFISSLHIRKRVYGNEVVVELRRIFPYRNFAAELLPIPQLS